MAMAARSGIIDSVVEVDGCWPFRGTVLWLTPEQGGRESGPPRPLAGADYVSTAYMPPRSIGNGLASFMLRGFNSEVWSSSAAARWLVPDAVGEQRVQSGSVIVVTEGARVVGYFHVDQVVQEP